PQVARRRLPLLAQNLQDRARVRRKSLRLVAARDAPQRVEVRDEPRRDERRAALTELRLVDPPASHHLVFKNPCQAALRVFLHVARHVRVAPPADRDVERRAGAARVRHRRAEADRLDELLRLDRRLDARLRLAPPHTVAVSLNLFGQRFDHSLSEDDDSKARPATLRRRLWNGRQQHENPAPEQAASAKKPAFLLTISLDKLRPTLFNQVRAAPYRAGRFSSRKRPTASARSQPIQTNLPANLHLPPCRRATH